MPKEVAYNPNDPHQTTFLAALALGESSGGPGSLYQGTGGANLANAPRNSTGFPEWGGFGNSHAAGTFQFQPGTWAPYAKEYGLNFANPQDQNAAAWYLAQDTYAQKTGGSLSDALAKGDYSSVQNALVKVWPSVTGNGASPGLAKALNEGKGVDTMSGGGSFLSEDTSLMGRFTGFMGSLNPMSGVSDVFVRIAIIAVGGAILLIALWYLLSDAGVVPSPTDTAKTVSKAALAVV